MEEWFKRGRPAIFKALTSVCDQIEHDVSEERHVYNQQVSQLTARTTELERTNEALELELQKLRSPCTKPLDGDIDVQREFDKLHARFTKLGENYRIVKGKYSFYKQSSTEYENKIKALERKVAGLEGRQIGSLHEVATAVEEVHSTPIQSPQDTIPPKQKNQPAVCPTGPPWQCEPSNLSRPSSRTQSPTGAIVGEADLPLLPPAEPSMLQKMPHIKMKQEPSSDGPVFVSEKFVGKRRREDSGSDMLHTIKDESGSDLIVAGKASVFSPQESLDLDDSGIVFPTPKKRRSLFRDHEVELHNNDMGTCRQIPSIGVRNEHPVLSSDRGAEPIQASISENGIPITPYYKQSVFLPVDRTRILPVSSLVVPVNVNSERLRMRRDLAAGVESLAEDGVDYRETAPTRETRDGNPTGTGRLGAILNSEPTSANEPPIIPCRKETSPRRRPISPLGMPARRELPFGTMGSPFKQPLDQTRNQIPSNSSHELSKRPSIELAQTIPPRIVAAGRLLDRPRSELRPEDFKVNPNYNDGLDYAYSEVVRGEGRAQLVGCVDEHCCGKYFRGLAMTSAKDRNPAADRALLENYMGETCYKLGTATKAEKDKMWLEAKTWELANKYGKHRHRYERQQSPPGFWDADFPTTQDLEIQRKEAKRREDEVIQNRYREAMRPGGRWIFRDE